MNRVSNPGFRKETIAKLFLLHWQAPIPCWEATKKECCNSILSCHLNFSFSLRKEEPNGTLHCSRGPPLVHLQHTRTEERSDTAFSLSPLAHPRSLPVSLLSHPPTSISLGSIFGIHLCLLNGSDYLFYWCWDSSTWKGMKHDLSRLGDTLLFAFGIWRRPNKTKHILTVSPP